MKRKVDLKWDPRLDPAASACALLPGLARQYFAQGRKAAEPNVSGARLHEFRLATKRLRYTLELFEPLYGPGIEARLKQVRRVQQVLGDVQDCETLRSMKGVRQHRKLKAWVERRLEKKRNEFQRLWQAEFDGEAAERRWLLYLERYARMK